MVLEPIPKQVTLLHTPERYPDDQSTQSVFVRERVGEKCTLTALGGGAGRGWNLYSLPPLCGMLHLQAFYRKQNLMSY